MKQGYRIITYSFFCLSIALINGCLTLKKDNTPEKVKSITIGTGEVNGVYYPVGVSIAEIINANTFKNRIQAAAKTSYNASDFNIIDVLNGDLNCGISQADDLFTSYHKAKKGRKLRAIFTLHTEALTLLATQKSRINQYKDLKGKLVRIGTDANLSQDIKEALSAEGVNPADIKQVRVKSVLCPSLIQKGKLDAYLFTVGHPNQNTEDALAGKIKVKMIPLSKQAIKKLLKKHPYYSQIVIPVSYYKLNARKVDTIGVKATFFTSEDADEKAIYNLTKAVFSNLNIIKNKTPALQNIRKKEMLEGILIPIHKGALKYYKEIGLK